MGDADLHVLAQASQDLALVVAGSGLAIGIPALHALAPSTPAALRPPATGAPPVLSGSLPAVTHAPVPPFAAAP